MKKRKKKFRLNIVIGYMEGIDPTHFRPPLLDILKHLSWLHKLEYSISVDHPGFSLNDLDGQSPDSSMTDLIYLRSTVSTLILAKDLRKIISCMFDKSFLWSTGVVVFYQLHKLLSAFLFPKDYCFQLDYPCVVVHKSGEVNLYVPDNILFDILSSDSDPQLN